MSAEDSLPPEKPERPKRARRAAKDITPMLKGWEYQPGAINVRKVTGRDGLPKVQMRLDLGLLQMELDGRPDGQRPHGCESLLEYFESQLTDHQQRNGTELGFHLTSDQCQILREEAVMYYHRYLSLFVLEEFNLVVRDTARNLRVLDLCGKYANDEQDRLILEQYRPYILMMNARAKASLLAKDKHFPDALKAVEQGLEDIRLFFVRFGQEQIFGQSSEVRLLKRYAKELRRRVPTDPMNRLQAQLERAIRHERYEDAAKLRDEIAKRKEQQSQAK